jgi:nucleotide-binding universal stress UspA family protein
MSTSTRPVIVAVDGERGSAGAMRYAVAEARRRGAPLHLVHVVPAFVSIGPGVPITDLHEVGVEILAAARESVAKLAPGLEVQTALAHGDVGRGVAEAAKHAQLLVVGRESRHGLDRLLTGAVTASVAAHAPCDVAVVPSFWLADRGRGRIVVGIKSNRNSGRLVMTAFAEAEARSARVVAVSAWQISDPYLDSLEARTNPAAWKERGHALLLHTIEGPKTEHPDVAVDLRVRHGSAGRVLLDASHDADLLVLGRHRTVLPPHTRLGSVAHAVLRLSEVPVLVVADRGEEDESDLSLEKAGAAVK